MQIDLEPIVTEVTKEHLGSPEGIEVIANATKEVAADIDFRQVVIDSVAKEINNIKATELQVTMNGTTVKVDMPHKQFELLLNVATTQLPIMLTGEAGSGKTHSVTEVAKAFNMPYYSLSVGEQTTKSDILGFIDAMGKVVRTSFREAFETGGIFLLDEVDAGNPNVLLAINTAISNGFVQFPDTNVSIHKDFQLIATANTYGTGGNMQYVGRNRLDKATLNRFIVIDWERDADLEAILCNNRPWVDTINKARELSKDIEGHLLSMRTAVYGAKLLKAGLDIDSIFPMLLTVGLDEYSTKQVENAKRVYTKLNTAISEGTQVIVTTGDYLGSLGTMENTTLDGSFIVRVKSERLELEAGDFEVLK